MNRIFAVFVMCISLVAGAIEPQYPWALTPTPQYPSAPAPCTLAKSGNLYYDTTLNSMQICNGATSTWVANGGVSAANSPMSLFVNSVSGNDATNCTARGAGACSTWAAAEALTPTYTNSIVTVTGEVGSTFPAGFQTTKHTCGPNGQFIYTGEYQNFVPATGTATGTLSAYAPGTVQSGPTLTDGTQAWTVNNLRGQDILIVSGTGAGQTGAIKSNTDKAIVLGGPPLTVALDNTSNYVIEDFGTSMTGPSSPAITQPHFSPTTPLTPTIVVNNIPGIQPAMDTGKLAPNTIPQSCVVIQRLKFAAGATRAIALIGGTLTVQDNQFNGNTSHDVSYWANSSGFLGFYRNAIISGSGRNLYLGQGTNGANFEAIGNVSIGGTGSFVYAQGAMNVYGFTSGNFYTGTGNFLEGPGSGYISAFADTVTGPNTCLTSAGFGAAPGSGAPFRTAPIVMIDDMSCSNPVTTFFSMAAGTKVYVDQSVIGSSAGTNSHAAPIVISNTGAQYLETSGTAWTLPGNNLDYENNSVGQFFTRAQCLASNGILMVDGSQYRCGSSSNIPYFTLQGTLLSPGVTLVIGDSTSGMITGSGTAIKGSFAGTTAAVAAPATVGCSAAVTVACVGAVAGKPIFCSPATTNQTGNAAEVVTVAALAQTDVCSVQACCASAACTAPPSVVYNCRNIQ